MVEIEPTQSTIGPFLHGSIIHLIERIVDAKNLANILAKRNLDEDVAKELSLEERKNLSAALELLERILDEVESGEF